MTTGMKIKGIEPRFGSKRTQGSIIVEELGEHRAYWNPFCGSLAVELQKPESSHETINDLDGNLINLARVIANEDAAVSLYGRLARVLCDEEIRDEALESLKTAADPIDRAYHYFIASWMGRNGFGGTVGWDKASFAVRWTPNGGHGGGRFRSAVESIPPWHHRLRRMTILHRCGFEVIESISDEKGVAVYLDPVYLVKAARYLHDDDVRPAPVASDEWIAAIEWAWKYPQADIKPERIAWHYCLAQRVLRFKAARVVISYYEHPLLAHLYPGWTVRQCFMSKGLHNSGKRGSTSSEAPEVLLINGPSFGGAV